MADKKLVEIIVHCYAQAIPDFAKLLTAQLSSVLLWPPELVRVGFTICVAPGDTMAYEAGRWFVEQYPTAHSCVVEHAKSHLFRRSIARDFHARHTAADIVWFADCDYLFGPGCLDALATANVDGLVFPGKAMIHKSHEAGDAELQKIKVAELFTPDLTIFQPWKLKFAIGGLQIVPGDVARDRGYLTGTKWTRPVPDAGKFLDTREDRAYRLSCGKSHAIDLPNLYRFRHSQSAFESAESRLAQTKGK